MPPPSRQDWPACRRVCVRSTIAHLQRGSVAGPNTASRRPSSPKARAMSLLAIAGMSLPIITTGPGGNSRATAAMRRPRSPWPCGSVRNRRGQGPERSGVTASQVIQRRSLPNRRNVSESVICWKRSAATGPISHAKRRLPVPRRGFLVKTTKCCANCIFSRTTSQ